MMDQNDKPIMDDAEKALHESAVRAILDEMIANGDVETKVIDGVRMYRWRREQ